MIRGSAEIQYGDGTAITVPITQYGIGRWAGYCAVKGYDFDPQNPGVMAVLQMRYMAWAEYQRTVPTQISFDAWDKTVDNVIIETPPDDVNPTQAAVSAAQ